MSKISRRRFLHNTALLGATLPFSYTSRQTSAQAIPALDLYIAIWPNFTRTKLSWKTSSPQQLAKEFSYMLWNYIQSHGHGLLAAIFSEKKSIIGHASLFAELRDGNTTSHIVFSNTGGNPGFYENPSSWMPPLNLPSHKFPKKYRNLERPIGPGFLACFFVDELLAGHVSNGKWESPNEYRDRVFENDNFRVAKHEYTGEQAKKISRLFNFTMSETGSEQYIGAPKYFGLNAVAVRDVNNFNQKLPVHPIPGGCANAVAGILTAIGLEKLVPGSARFSINNGKGIDLQSLAKISVPIVTRGMEYENRKPTDQKLKDALNSVPQTWGNGGEQIEFVDPNYWYPTLDNNRMLKEQFKAKVQLASKTQSTS